MGKKGGKKGKGKKESMATDATALTPWAVRVHDIIQTPLGVEATVLGVQGGDLWLQWPGQIKSPLPNKAKDKPSMESFGYVRKPQWSHIQRSIDERQNMLFHQRYYGGPGPRTAALRLPWPRGFEQTLTLPKVEQVRPSTAP